MEQKDSSEKRREKRYDIPDACRQYIKLQVKSEKKFVPALLGNFSRNGILFECPVAFSKGTRTECVLSISLLVSREISFIIEIMYCYADNGSSIMGASIDSISDETWFDVFVEVYDFIVLRQGMTTAFRHVQLHGERCPASFCPVIRTLGDL